MGIYFILMFWDFQDFDRDYNELWQVKRTQNIAEAVRGIEELRRRKERDEMLADLKKFRERKAVRLKNAEPDADESYFWRHVHTLEELTSASYRSSSYDKKKSDFYDLPKEEQ